MGQSIIFFAMTWINSWPCPCRQEFGKCNKEINMEHFVTFSSKELELWVKSLTGLKLVVMGGFRGGLRGRHPLFL